MDHIDGLYTGKYMQKQKPIVLDYKDIKKPYCPVIFGQLGRGMGIYLKIELLRKRYMIDNHLSNGNWLRQHGFSMIRKGHPGYKESTRIVNKNDNLGVIRAMIDYGDYSNSMEQFVSTEDNDSYEKLKQEILPYISKQQDTQIRDSLENRWIKCKKCGTVGMDHKFGMYGGKGEVNLGVCYDCIRKK